MSDASGVLFYDARCAPCAAAARRLQPLLARRHFAVRPLHEARPAERREASDAEWYAEMRVVAPDGRQFGGGDAVLELARYFWWARPLHWLGRWAPARRLCARAYRVVARLRPCAGGACSLSDHQAAAAVAGASVAAVARRPAVLRALLPLLLLPVATAFALRAQPGWILMTGLATALWLGVKWLAWSEVRNAGLRPGSGQLSAYFLAYPNTDGWQFLRARGVREIISGREWFTALVITLTGIAMVYAGPALGAVPLLAGWMGIGGLLLMFHFGLFELIVLGWRARGFHATPLMRAPFRSRSLGEFWGSRWNTGFSGPARRYLLVPLARRIGVGGALLTVFAVSGLCHELVISVPAGGSYGLPTLYFLGQGTGVLLERTFAWRKRGLLFVWVVTLGPLFWLFHRRFIEQVVLPLLEAIGSGKGGPV